MPQLSDLVKMRTDKKFTKKEYRPWDLSGSGTVDNMNPVEPINIQQQPSILVTSAVPALEPLPQLEVDTEVKLIKTDNELSNDSDNNQITIRQQLNNNQITAEKQPDHKKVTTGKQRDYQTDNELDHNDDIVLLGDHIRKLTGIQKKIFFYIVDLCTSRGQLDTGVVLTNDLTIIANCSFGSAKTSLSRLVDKNLILRKRGKASRGGHIVLAITKEIQAAAVQSQRFNISPSIRGLTDNINDNKLDNNISYSSNSYLNNNITTKLPPNWEEIDFSILSDIGFSKTQLLQLYNKQLNTPEIIQESINHFAFALKNNKKVSAYPEPLNVLMGVLRKGMNWFEQNYVSPREKALENFLLQKKQEAERIQFLEKLLLEQEFKIWITQLSDSEKNTILGSAPKSNLLSKNLADKTNEGFLLQYFKDNIYNKSNN
jgi:hypothetical protein